MRSNVSPNVLDLADFGRDPRSSDSFREIVFPKKTQKLLTEFPGLASSGRHNFANSCTVRCAVERDLFKFSATSVVRYCPIVLVRPRATNMALVRPSERYIEEKAD